SATGNRPAEMPPSRRITTESTHARTGRLMKIRASMTNSPSPPRAHPEREGVAGDVVCYGSGLRRDLLHGRLSIRRSGLRGRHFTQVCLNGRTRPSQLQTVDDHPLPGFQAVGDLAPAVVECPEPNGAGGYPVVLVHDVDHLLPLVRVQCAFSDEHG